MNPQERRIKLITLLGSIDQMVAEYEEVISDGEIAPGIRREVEAMIAYNRDMAKRIQLMLDQDSA